ncbi:hypothetical protein [Cellulomonas sp. A375-1]|uniref:hypothetical protein n=1 Tax=Cellulomonas sp. A375-1 TaxID=1672219 RepID=UPI000A9F58E3|nr:hypothetical protein [Cellulomonas sp. A375-1]
MRRRRARAAAVSLTVAAACALAAVLTAAAAPTPYERDESLALSLDAVPTGTTSTLLRVVRVPTPVRVTDVVVTTSGPDDLTWTVELCGRSTGECRPVTRELVGDVLPAGAHDLRVDVDRPAPGPGAAPDAHGPGAVADSDAPQLRAAGALAGLLALREESPPARDLRAVGALVGLAAATTLTGAVLLRPDPLPSVPTPERSPDRV